MNFRNFLTNLGIKADGSIEMTPPIINLKDSKEIANNYKIKRIFRLFYNAKA
jgi:hypothetical protein